MSNDFESILEAIGPLGCYQTGYLILEVILIWLAATQIFANIYLEAVPDHWCHIPELANLSVPEQFNLTAPPGELSDRSCRVRPINYTEAYGRYVLDHDDIPQSEATVVCTQWDYQDDVFGTTAVSEWNLICEKRFYPSIAQFVFMAGITVSPLLWGLVADRFGRRKAICISATFVAISGVGSAFAPEFWSHVALRTLAGFFVMGAAVVGMTLCVEVFGAQYRTVPGLSVHVVFPIGYLSLAAIAYSLKSFFWTNVAVSLPAALLLLYWCVIHESPRWLLIKGKVAEAKAEVMRAAKVNQAWAGLLDLDNLVNNCTLTKTDKKGKTRRQKLTDLLKRPRLCTVSVCVLFNWFVLSGVFYGIMFMYTNAMDNFYFSQIVFGIVDLFAATLLILALTLIGRRSCIAFLAALSGGTVIAASLLTSDFGLVFTVLVIISRVSVSLSHLTMYLITLEIYPTLVRTTVLGTASTVGHVGAAVFPLLSELRHIWPPLPGVVFGACAILAACITLHLPETRGEKLPDTVEDSDRLARKSYSFCIDQCCCEDEEDRYTPIAPED